MQESARKYVEVVWACIEKKRRICRQESDGDGGAGGKEGEEDRSGSGWITPGSNDMLERELSGEEAQYCWRLFIRYIETT